MKHYFPDYVRKSENEIGVLLVGCGATGSQVLSGLARIHVSLRALGRPGLDVVAMDGDRVAVSNIGRQLYSRSDLGRNKAEVFITRVNMFFGLRWKAVPHMLTARMSAESIPRGFHSQFVITAVDTVEARELVAKHVKSDYHLDLGNTRDTGQVVLGTRRKIAQPKGEEDVVSKLPTVFDLYRDIKVFEKGEIQGPSCSVADALKKQDLFINQAVATQAVHLLWDGFRQGYLTNHGAFINLGAASVRPLPIDPDVWVRMRGSRKKSVRRKNRLKGLD